MLFYFHKNAKNDHIDIDNELYNHIFRSKRSKIEQDLKFRNLEDHFLYTYKVEEISKKSASLVLKYKIYSKVTPNKSLHIIWSIVDPKTVEKVLPLINEIGVSKITFVYTQRSQKDFKINLERLNKILINSCSQCGRSDLLEIEICNSLEDLIKKYDDFVYLNFGGELITKNALIDRVLIGPEGGFCDMDLKLLKNKKQVAFDSPLVLKSESALLAVSSILIL